jgi:hypothetical protein
MDINRKEEITKLAYFKISKAYEYLGDKIVLNEINKSYQIKYQKNLNEESEIPGFENKRIGFHKFINKEFVVMMTDIRKSTNIINSFYGVNKMFLIFYSYSAVVANIVDKYKGTATEFLGDGVLSLFDCENGRDDSLINSYLASKDIIEANSNILNPIYKSLNLPSIDLGIGIDFGNTIVTRFGYKNDNDLKAFGKCVYNVSKLCKGNNEIKVSINSQSVWPSSTNGTLRFMNSFDVDGKPAFSTYNI